MVEKTTHPFSYKIQEAVRFISNRIKREFQKIYWNYIESKKNE